MTLAVLANSQDALSARYTATRSVVYIGGVMTDFVSYTTSHRVGQTSTATIVLTLPMGDHIQPNAEVIIEDGHNNLVGRRFWGRIPRWTKNAKESGDLVTINAVGWSSLLTDSDRFELTFTGPITIRAIIDSLCSRRGVPSYRADAVLDETGIIEASLGSNPNVDDGLITISNSNGYLSYARSITEPFKYYVYDDIQGTVRTSRVSGLPNTAPIVNFIESDNIIESQQDYSIDDIVNYWEVIGQTYEDSIGRSIPIRAIPASVPADSRIPVNDGVRYQQYRNNIIDTQQLAEIVRNGLEIDSLGPDEPVRWTSVAVPNVSPGDVVSMESTTLGIDTLLWVRGVDVSCDENGLIATYEGWAGGGRSLPAGVDRITIPIQDGAVHMGDENLSWYAHPAPQGLEMSWDFTIPKRATAVNVVFRVHGSNSQFIGGKNEDLEVSKFELWKLPIVDPEEDKAYSSGNLPILNEDYALRLKYATDDTKWSDGAIALKGFDEEQVDVRLKLISGKNADASGGPQDDFEIKNMYVEIYGTVEPVIIPVESQ